MALRKCWLRNTGNLCNEVFPASSSIYQTPKLQCRTSISRKISAEMLHKYLGKSMRATESTTTSNYRDPRVLSKARLETARINDGPLELLNTNYIWTSDVFRFVWTNIDIISAAGETRPVLRQLTSQSISLRAGSSGLLQSWASWLGIQLLTLQELCQHCYLCRFLSPWRQSTLEPKAFHPPSFKIPLES